ncbi:hypothetical protein A2856_02545 [Candidatus Uhrbacteria bacterium RIFCSPHIGHO2_01_FULL_63_20]|uniref:EfeO-type cupredoxin-like domain-containing protein n=1 Tax=Candidatus Uhrbacteria bacterium RIFCSPHIGHO2_01_FULL_63_20 TaxID=1802385 RepID=A0A1F7TKM9_9BACT|nr:MAG: hypothetical protein A2856_02545 [Candidatus Uhrbacteria bacterium RIFCSPHIGHO2_01_FULL_63_20]
MKKASLLLSALALIGAGCSAAPPTPTAVTPSPEPTIAVGEPNPAPPAEEPTPAPTPTAPETLKVNMEVANFSFAPNAITAKAGQKVDVTFAKNEGFHTFVIDGVTKLPIAVGTTKSFIAPTKPGSYPFYCDVGSHRSMGMEGTLIVQ